MKDGTLRLFCAEGFASGGEVNRVVATLNGINVSLAVGQLWKAYLQGDVFDEVEHESIVAHVLHFEVEASESFGLGDLACCMEDFLKLDVAYIDGEEPEVKA